MFFSPLQRYSDNHSLCSFIKTVNIKDNNQKQYLDLFLQEHTTFKKNFRTEYLYLCLILVTIMLVFCSLVQTYSDNHSLCSFIKTVYIIFRIYLDLFLQEHTTFIKKILNWISLYMLNMSYYYYPPCSVTWGNFGKIM